MKFTIILPVYNVRQYLHACLDSVLIQTFTDFEVICINDGSTDNSLVVLEEYAKKDDRIKIFNQENKGLSGARNRGITEAKGDYLFLLDSDDWIEPTTLEILTQKQSGEDLVCFNGRRYFEDGTNEEPDNGIDETRLTGWEYYNKYALVSRKFHFVCTVLRIYRRDYLLKNNLFFEEGVYHEDNLFTPIVCYYAQTVKVIPDCLYVYRIREGSIMQTNNVKRIFDTIEVANKLSEFFIPIIDIDKSQLYKEIAGEYFGTYTYENRKLFGNIAKRIKTVIYWANFKKVSIYPRHRRIYLLLNIHPILFRVYIWFEVRLKIVISKF